MDMVKTAFENGEYAKWIRDFQQKNPETISFSNRVNQLNNNSIEIVSLNPLRIKSKDISPEDFENLGMLNAYYEYLKSNYGKADDTSLVISVGGKLYTLVKDTKPSDTEDVVLVVDTDDEADETPVFTI